MTEQLVTDILRRADRLKADRSVREGHWDEVRKFENPDADEFFGRRSPGAKTRQFIVDNVAEQAGDLLAGALHGHLTQPGTRWFDLRVEGLDRLDDEAALWLEDTTDKLYRALERPGATFGSTMGDSFVSDVFFGTSVTYIADRPGARILFQPRPLAESLIAQNADGKVDTLYRRWRWTAREAVQEFGKAAGAKVVDAAGDEKRADNKFEFVHAVFPRADRVHGRIDARNMEFASVWVNVDEKHEIRQSGFEEFPYVVSRWKRRGDDRLYGRSPGMTALPDVKYLQRLKRAQIRGLEKIVDPTLMVADDGVIGPVSLASGGIITVRSEYLTNRQEAVRALASGARPDVAAEEVQAVHQAIQSAFYNHLLQLSRDPRMTATHVLKLDEETLRVLGPFLGAQQEEKLDPAITRTYAILSRRGAFLPPPPSLAGRSLRVEYQSPMMRAQRLSEVTAAAQLGEVLAPYADRNPAIMDNFDDDDIARNVAKGLGLWRTSVRDPRKVREIRDARAQQAQQQAAVDQFAELAPAMQSAAQAAGSMANDNNSRPAAADGGA